MSVKKKLGAIFLPTGMDPGSNKAKEGKKDLGQVKVGDLGTSAEFLNVAKTYLAKANAAQQQQQGPRIEHFQHAPGSRAYMHPHFNQIGMDKTNLGQSSARAIRGDKSILDLKAVVLIPPAGGQTPEPQVIRHATQIMGLTGELDMDMASLLGQQASWAQQKGMTIEKLKERLKRMREMVALRKQALARMQGKQYADQPATSVTVEQASWAEQRNLDQVEDPVEAGTLLVNATKRQAAMMHFHLAKLMGIKQDMSS